MNDMQMKAFTDKRGFECCISHRDGRGRSDLQRAGGHRLAQLHCPRRWRASILGKITKWNDPALVKANPGVKLPKSDIVVVHRTDGSGTTYCLDGLSFQGQQGMGDEGGPRQLR